MKDMRILGIDPGLGRVGFGLLEIVTDPQTGFKGKYGPCQWGVITTTKDKSDGARLQEIHKDLTMLIGQLQPDMVAIERLFYFKNVTTFVPVAQARGVILMVIESFGLPVFEYTPLQVKQAITGYGKSEKKEIQNTLISLLDLDRKPTPDDAADGLALAVCHYNHAGRLAHLTEASSVVR